jgi:hypothetical protein
MAPDEARDTSLRARLGGAAARPRPRGRLGLVIVVIAVVGIALVATFAYYSTGGPSPPTVTVTSASLSDPSHTLTGDTLPNATFSGPAGGSVTVRVYVRNTQADDLEMCVTSSSISPSSFTIQALDPPNVCVFAQSANVTTSTPLYFTLGLPGSAFDGPVTISVQDQAFVMPE